MRRGFAEIASGWRYADSLAELRQRLRRLKRWISDNGGDAALEPDEIDTRKWMLEGIDDRKLDLAILNREYRRGFEAGKRRANSKRQKKP